MNNPKRETPARGETRPGRGYRYATAAGTPNIAQTQERDIVIYYFTIVARHAGVMQSVRSLALRGREAKTLLSLRDAAPAGFNPSPEDQEDCAASVQALRENYALPITEWRCKGGGDAKRGSRLYVFDGWIMGANVFFLSRADLVAILAGEGEAK